jgi:hypothetical protein
MNKKVSYIISAVFQPIIINFVIILLIFNYFPSLAALSKNKIITIIGVIVSLTLILPIIVVTTLKLTNQIESIQLKKLKDRKWPFLFTCIGYLMSFYLLNKAGVSVIILKYLGSKPLFISPGLKIPILSVFKDSPRLMLLVE